MSTTQMPNGQPAAQAQQRKAMLQSFRKNTRKRIAQWNYGLNNITSNAAGISATAPQVGLASRIWIQFSLVVEDTTTSPSVAKLARGPYGFVQRVQFVTNLGSNNIWDCDGWNTHYNNLTKSVSSIRSDYGYDNAYNSAAGTSAYANDPYFQYPAVTAANTQYNVCFTLRLDLNPNPGINFSQGLLNLQAPQVQASIICNFGNAASTLYSTSDSGFSLVSGSAIIWYEYFEIPNPLRKVALPSGMLHCTLQQNQAITSTGLNQYTIQRQGILLRLQQETVINNAWAYGGPAGAAGNPGTVGIDWFNLQLNNSDTIYTKNWALQKAYMLEEFPALQNFLGMQVFENFGAMDSDQPCRGDFRDAIDTEAVTTTQFGTYINSGATLGSLGSNYFNFVREILLPFNTQAAGSQVA